MIQPSRASLPATGVNLPVSSFEVGGARMPELLLQAVTLAKEVGKHDSATVSCKFATSSLPDIEDQPISFVIGSGSSRQRFHGFIYSAGKAQKVEGGVSTTLKCIGATVQAKAPVFGLLRDVTAEQVAERVLPGVGFSHYSSGSTAIIPRISLTGRSAWEAVTVAASETAREVVPFDGAVWIFDPLQELEKGIPVHSFRKTIDAKGLGSGDRDLLDFTPGSATPEPKGELPRTAWFASDGSVKTRIPEGSSEESYWASNVYVPSSAYAQLLYERVRRDTLFNHTATARVRGVAGVVPGNIVNISTGITSLLTDTYDGLWLVTSVTHAVSDGDFQTGLKLVRDKYRPPRRGTYEWFYEKDRRMYPVLRLNEDRRWQSSWRGR